MQGETFIALSGTLTNILVLLLAYQMFSTGEMLQEDGVILGGDTGI